MDNEILNDFLITKDYKLVKIIDDTLIIVTENRLGLYHQFTYNPILTLIKDV